MKINLFLDKRDLKNSNLIQAIMDYYKRITKFVKINVYYSLDNKLIGRDDYNINVTTVDGEYMNSIEFSDIIKYKSINRVKNINIFFVKFNKLYHNICFVCFNLSKDLLVLILLEQIYRAYKIINNEPYHK
ncbi:23S rRNA (pseudouridine(1915)-N(3))-methyltransferase RlmH [Candidatus Arthromitus sp. SFB-rat-Yit]|uniref:23S rRNA (pseudouridine(1915)-N(3))-methyltransferase RlmH n=1 Tax=Candidatus Arthromitus sp. SFB-rat-Yit TaxID=1041504 RepID=UPI000227A843|nr:23S rRNA (pseudouridine(1915)-N(3))-methyltransferase RlmH [Candidatus Arthromitus sp. SFB-rat-Yit]BAK81882.1 SPOUT methyltransferase [Candidatus Arthromitus sp. SFB-rat-Yit]